MWTPTTRQQHSRPVTRYQTDLTEAEWCVLAPHLPKPCAIGPPRERPMREILNGIFYVSRAGCPWRLLSSGKTINERKRHALALEPDPASIPDRNSGGPLIRASRAIFPFVQRLRRQWVCW
jgi:putative transposase of IS4/5 family DUF4096